MIHKTGYEKKFIQSEAHNLLANILVYNVISMTLVDQLVDGCQSKNTLVQQNCLESLHNAVKTSVKVDTDPVQLSTLLTYLNKACTDPISKVKVSAKKAIKAIAETLGGKEKVIELFQQVLEEQTDVKGLESVFVEKKKKKAGGGFREFMKTMKQTNKGSDPFGMCGKECAPKQEE